VNQSGVAVIVAEEATMNHTSAGLVVASKINAKNSRIALLLGGTVEGRPDIAVDARVAAIIGASAVVTLFILRRLFRS
jgi:hypothetical protein